MPATPYDAKGLMVSAIKDENPVIYIDDRWLYSIEDEVPEEIYSIPIGKGIVRKKGKDVTLVSISYMVVESMKAAEVLKSDGIDIEVIDLRSIKPIDEDIIFESVEKTGRLVIADASWKTCGVAAEITTLVVENIFYKLKSPVRRVTLPDVPAPASSALEKIYYPSVIEITKAVRKVLS
jgi:pyruvate dehydrogenase E1 component beta subunit